MRTLFSLIFLVTTLLLLGGCGGGQPSSSLRGVHGSATFTVVWPSLSRLSASGRLIPAAANSITVSIQSGANVLASQIVARPTNGSASTLTFNALSAGALTATATAYPTANGTGTAQAQAKSPLSILPNQNTPITLVMASTIDHLELTPPTPALQVAQRLQLTVTAKDAAGNVVLTTPSALQWTPSTPALAVVDANGIVSALAVGSVTITAMDTESGKQVNTTLSITQAASLVSWWRAEGNPNDSVGGNNGTIFGNVTYSPGVVGQAFTFDGVNGTVSIPDATNLKITSSLTIDARIYVKGYPSAAKYLSMILFRGDQRDGFDPYYLGVGSDGTIGFSVQNDANAQYVVQTPIAVGKWIHVTATLDGNSGVMSLYLDGQLAIQKTTSVRPLRDLDPTQLPGVAIGNSSGYPQGNFNYTFNGLIDEVKVYNSVVAPGL